MAVQICRPCRAGCGGVETAAIGPASAGAGWFRFHGMSKNAAAEFADKLRRHVRIALDLGKLATQTMELDSFLQQTVVQVARAVEIDHVKIMRYRPDRGDLLLVTAEARAEKAWLIRRL
jgi:hypothetical protein